MAIYFKEVPDDALQDPGPELTGVLEFRKKLEKEHTALYRQFSSVEDFELKVTLFLISVVERKSRPATPIAPAGTVDKVSPTEEVPGDSEPQLDDESRRQIADALGNFHNLVRGGKVDSLDADRLLLFSMAVQPENVAIPTHPLNRIYDMRDEYVLSVMEYRLLVWTIAANFQIKDDGSIRSVAPGFKLITDNGTVGDLEEVLVSQILGPETEFSVARGSLAILQSMKARPAGLWEAEMVGVGEASLIGNDVTVSGGRLVDKWTHILETAHVEEAALRYIYSVIRNTDSPVFEAVSERLSDAPVAAKVRALAAYARGSVIEISDLAAARYISEGSLFEQIILAALEKMDSEQLAMVVSGRALPDHVVRKAFETLMHHRTPSAEEFGQLLRSKSRDLIDFAFEAAGTGGDQATRNLLEAATGIKNEDTLSGRRERLTALVKTENELRAEMSEPLTYGDAWTALSWMCGSRLSNEAREILDTDCSEALKPEKMENFSERLGDFLKSELRKAALSLLARVSSEEREPQDIERFRVELARNDRMTVMAAADALISFGTSADVEILLPLREKVYNEEKSRLLKGIVKLGGLDTARMLIADEDEGAAMAGALALSSDASVPLGELQRYLYNPHDSVRMEIWKGVEKRMSRSELEKYLSEYRSRNSGYYYDVVAAMDARLYLPQ
ncbi:hypothetical protein ACFXAW_14590 [Streptomyces sp. NPDC059445]|uniref:hypothetical protein n=1 Tax=Streptomyces sp. NPDC059445 TaxID=3346832 RepID=UPI003678171D